MMAKEETEPLSRVCLMITLTTEPVDVTRRLSFTFINVYSYSSISKQKFSFMSEAKEGYLSTPPMLYSCMNIS
jgi:hypothetical protein